MATLPAPGSDDAPTLGPDPAGSWELSVAQAGLTFSALDLAGAEPVPATMAGWDRYEVLDFLGAGGMARVYRARDLRLNRMVALKFIREENPVLARLLTLEAQFQASLEHDNILKVYETGEFDGKPFIAMQLVQGRTLDQLAGEDLRVRVALLAQVGRALQAAHLRGMVHRDLKPGNIMVETLAGGLKPYLMDFGLARLTNVPGQTLATSVMGTLSYMAPEQAEGNRPLDIRTDIHAIGAILYEFLCGHPPFTPQATTPKGEIVRRLLLEEALPPRQLNPEAPRDLATIAMKCLEKQPEQRYGSAAAVAADLESWLEGRPIEARPAGFLERTLKAGRRLRANGPAWRIAQAGALVVALLLGGGTWALWRARRRAEFVAGTGVLLVQVEDLLRTSSMGPVHDTRPDRARVEALLAEIRRQAAAYGGLADGPLAYALGRCHLALQQPEQARIQLERAWALGFRSPAVAASLGQALAEVYQVRLGQLDRISDPQRRRETRAALGRSLREPALAFLARSQGGGPEDREYRAALADGLSGRSLEALRRAEQLTQGDPLALRFLLLRAKAERALALEAADRGDHPGALARQQAASQVLVRALDVARSDRSSWLALAEAQSRILYEFSFLPGDAQAAYAQGSQACARARSLNPDDPGPLLAQAELTRSLARVLENRGQDPSARFREAIELAERALLLDPRDPLIQERLGELNWALANGAVERHQPATALLAEAEQHLQRCLALQPGNVNALSKLLDVVFDRCQDQERRGEDILPALDRAQAVFQQARQLEPDNARMQSLGVILAIQHGITRASRGLDPLPDFGAALALADGLLARNPGAENTLVNRSMVLRLRAQHSWRLGAPFAADLAEAIATAERTLAIRDGMEGRVNLAQALTFKADFAARAGQDPEPALTSALEHLRQAGQLDGRNPDIPGDRIEALLVLGAWQLRQGRPPAAALATGRAELERARQLAPEAPGVVYGRARLLELEAAAAAASGRPSAPILRAALAPWRGQPGPALLTPELLAIQARLLAQLAKAAPAPGLEQQARAAMAAVLARNPFLKRENS
jgi:serine/threonine-protein kinase